MFGGAFVQAHLLRQRHQVCEMFQATACIALQQLFAKFEGC